MALETQVLKITAPATTGSQTYGTNFVPKAIILFSTLNTAEGQKADQAVGIGFASSATDTFEFLAAARSDDNLSTTNNVRYSGSNSLDVEDSTGFISGNLTSFNSSPAGFTYNWTSTRSGAIVIAFVLGGTDITNVFAGVQNNVPTVATNPYTISGVGFQPDFVFFLYNYATFGLNTSNVDLSIGAATSSSKRWALSMTAQDAQNMTASMNCERAQLTTRCVIAQAASGAIDMEIDFVNFNSDGFVLNLINPPTPSSTELMFIAFKGGSYDVGAFNACTTANCNNDINVGFTPTGLLLSTFNNATSAGSVANAEQYYGVGDGTSEGAVGSIADDGILPSRCDTAVVSTKVLRCLVGGNPSPVESEADHFFPAGGAPANSFRLTWTDEPPAAHEICYASFGSTAGAAAVARFLTLLGAGT